MAQCYTARRFAYDEAELLRQLRLTALRDTPEAFGAGYEQDAGRPAAFWQNWIVNDPPYGVFCADRVVGMAGFWRQRAANLAHRGLLGGMYVLAEARGSGAADILVRHLLCDARQVVEQVHLCVNSDNKRAERFYRRMGFVSYGLEPSGLRFAGVDHDVVLMVHMLGRRPH